MSALTLLGCARSQPSTPGTTCPGKQRETRAVIDRLRGRDGELRRRFSKIEKEMSQAEVRRIMGSDPDLVKDDIWVYWLSRLADTLTERDWRLVIRFQGGKVLATETTYTCHDIRFRD